MVPRETTLTRKGQVTIPLEIRARLGLKPRDRVVFEMAGEVAVLRPARSRLLEGYGAVSPKQRPEDFKAVEQSSNRMWLSKPTQKVRRAACHHACGTLWNVPTWETGAADPYHAR